jgi:hypothetical protein
MWNYSIDEWKSEVLSSLKKTDIPVFEKNIFSGENISPFSFGSEAHPIQVLGGKTSSFLAIQNYEDLVKSGMNEWLRDPALGFRFRQLDDIQIDESLSNKTLFLSQPFPFLPSEKQKENIQKWVHQNHSLNLGWSPLSFGLTRGEILKKPFMGWDRIFNSECLHQEKLKWFYISSAPYQWAGAEPHVELGIVLSLAYVTLTELNAVGVSAEKSVSRFSFGLALGTDILIESSKVAALKILWARLNELVSDQPEKTAAAEIYALPSLRYFSGRDSLNNLLRTTLMSLSAMLGGASGFKCIPYDVLCKNKSPDSFRISTNVPLILSQEAYTVQTDNPLDGSPLFSETTMKICENAWIFFQEIEKKGGIFEAVRSGWLQNELKRQEEYSKNQLCYFQKEFVGVNKYVSKDLQAMATEPSDIIRLRDIIDPLFLTKSPDDYLNVEPLVVNSLSYDWDIVQVQSDRYLKLKGHRPLVKAIKGGGPIVEKKLSWLMNLVGVGGLAVEVLTQENLSSLNLETDFVILIPSHDEMEEQMISRVRPLMKGKIWSCNEAKENSKIDKFIQTEMNSLELIKEMQSLAMGGV